MIESKYLKKIRKIKKNYLYKNKDSYKKYSCRDEEVFHMELDELLVEFLLELGYIEVVKQYKELQGYFWYS